MGPGIKGIIDCIGSLEDLADGDGEVGATESVDGVGVTVVRSMSLRVGTRGEASAAHPAVAAATTMAIVAAIGLVPTFILSMIASCSFV
ncbi:hypothetical protein [Streptomyces wuyuanensis]|uniref:hypothetical protein n=1 Tax=Streptomyces wuyuanensis TaxID=1196353 RepID=UPI00343421B6